MAPTAEPGLTGKLLKALAGLCGAVLLIAMTYLLAAWAGSSIPRNREWREPPEGVTIGVETNGVHTALVLPISSAAKDWRVDFPLADLGLPDRPYTHMSISWGEREVFLNTPTWWDLSPRTVLRVLAGQGEGLLHVSYYARPVMSESLRPLRLTTAEYAQLVAAIENHLPAGRPLRAHRGYGRSDVFYDAGGDYTAIMTCNQWTSDRLADAGIRTGWWTPLEGGVMKWVPPIR